MPLFPLLAKMTARSNKTREGRPKQSVASASVPGLITTPDTPLWGSCVAPAFDKLSRSNALIHLAPARRRVRPRTTLCWRQARRRRRRRKSPKGKRAPCHLYRFSTRQRPVIWTRNIAPPYRKRRENNPKRCFPRSPCSLPRSHVLLAPPPPPGPAKAPQSLLAHAHASGVRRRRWASCPSKWPAVLHLSGGPLGTSAAARTEIKAKSLVESIYFSVKADVPSFVVFSFPASFLPLPFLARYLTFNTVHTVHMGQYL